MNTEAIELAATSKLYVALAEGTRQLLPAHPVHVVDTTAAGDAFNGALAVAFLDGQSPVDSALSASAVAAISVTRPGAQASLPTVPVVDRFLEDSRSAKSTR